MGLHLNISEGIPILDPGSIPSLIVVKDGIPQFRGKEGFIAAEQEGAVSVEDVVKELRAQVRVLLRFDTRWSDSFLSWVANPHTWTDISMCTCIRTSQRPSPSSSTSTASPRRASLPKTWTKSAG